MRIKSIFLVAVLVLSLAACDRGDHDWKHFKEKYAVVGTTIRLNGLMKLGLQIFAKADDDPQTRALLHILRKMHGVEITVIPQARAHYQSSEVGKLAEHMGQHDYQSLINVRSGDQLVNLWARGNGDDFTDPLILVQSGHEVVMVEMKGTLTTGDIRTLTDAGMKYADQAFK